MSELLAAVQAALRSELVARGYSVAEDTGGFEGRLHIWGEGDKAAALFEFKCSAEEACHTMYEGSWPATLPPRFAVLPVGERCSPDVDMLLQAGLSTLFYEVEGEEVAFPGLDEAVAKIRVDPKC